MRMASVEESAILLLFVYALFWIHKRRKHRQMQWIQRKVQHGDHFQRFQRLQQRQLANFTVCLSSTILRNGYSSHRRVWITLKSSSFWDEIGSVWSNEFKKNFRLSRTTFRYLCSQLQPHLQNKRFDFKNSWAAYGPGNSNRLEIVIIAD